MDKLRALRDRFQNRETTIDRAEAFVLALEVLDVVTIVTDSIADGVLTGAEAAAIHAEVAELRAVVAEALAD